MNRYILLSRPRHDRGTRYISAWARYVAEEAEAKQDKVLDLEDARANRKTVESMITRNRPSLFVFHGHGNDDAIFGHDNEVLISVDDNEELLHSGIVYALACRAAKSLGLKCIQKGTRTFIGYDEDFWFLWDERYRTKPLDDRVARLFLEPSNSIAISFIKGHSAREAYNHAREFYLRNIRKLLTSESSAEETASIPFLVWDAQHLVCHGDAEAKFI